MTTTPQIGNTTAGNAPAFTPGETWCICANGRGDETVAIRRASSPHKIIADMVCNHKHARLIAAAPELLESAKNILPLVQALRDSIRSLGRNDLLNDIEPGRVADLRAAIAKACGAKATGQQ